MRDLNLTLMRATPEALEVLVPLRLEALRAANGLGPRALLPGVEAATRRYYAQRLGSDMHVEYLAYLKGQLAGCGAASIYDVMPTVGNPSGKKAYIMNIYTRPQFRRQGVARRVLQALVQEVHDMGIAYITLEATESGRPMYEKAGFVAMQHEMLYVGRDKRIVMRPRSTG